MKTISLFEQYRPTNWGEFIGHDRVTKTLDLIRKRSKSLAGRAYFISGKSGTGKTTLARLIAREIASEYNIEELEAGDLTTDKLKDIVSGSYTYGMGERQGRAYIINEAHGLRKDIVRRLLVVLEEIPDHVAFIFTTTSEGLTSFGDGEDSGPFLSRCLLLTLETRGLTPLFTELVDNIALKEGLIEGRDKSFIKKLIDKNGQNLRAVLQAVEAGALIA